MKSYRSLSGNFILQLSDMNLLRKIEETPLTFDDLKRMLGDRVRDTKLMEYDELKQFSRLSDVFGDNKAVIILMEIEGPNAPKVGHWISILDQGDHYEHFDSYGLSADEELSLTHEEPFLATLLHEAGKRVEDSGTRYQSIREHVNTCGRWVVARIRMQDLTLRDFKKLMDQAHTVPDISVAMLTLLL